MAMQGKHMCAREPPLVPSSFLRLLCNFAQNILDIMSHLGDDVSSSIYDRTLETGRVGERKSLLKGFLAPKEMQSIFKYLWAINTWANLLRNLPSEDVSVCVCHLCGHFKIIYCLFMAFRLFRF